MTERRITVSEVKAVVSDPQISYHGQRGEVILIGYPEGRKIKVVLDTSQNPARIITVAD